MHSSSYTYSQATDDDDVIPKTSWSPRHDPSSGRSWTRRACVGLIIGTAIVLLLGLFAPGYISSSPEIPLDDVSIELQFEPIYGGPPTPPAEKAWADLFPEQSGFLIHPQLAPERSCVSVFHQLHCLNAVRLAYWDLHSMATAGEKLSPDHFTEMTKPHHITHCIDLIRQVLMCNPDLTMELRSPEGGVTGFGTTHQCKNFDQLIGFVSQWERYQQNRTEYEARHHHDHSI